MDLLDVVDRIGRPAGRRLAGGKHVAEIGCLDGHYDLQVEIVGRRKRYALDAGHVRPHQRDFQRLG